MDVLFLSPAYPPEMQQFTRGLAEVGARVWGVGDTPREALPEAVRRHLTGYLQVPRMLDEDDVLQRVQAWLGGRRPDRIEGLWEVVTLLAARLREALDVPGMSVDVVHGFRDKQRMKERVARAGLRVPRSGRASTVAEVRARVAEIGLPVVIKPVDGAGSADTHRVDSAEALERVIAATAHVREVVVEEFIAGQEYTYETLCVDGRPVFHSISMYVPNTLIARQNEWISPIILTLRDLDPPELRAGKALGDAALGALGMASGFTHMEWFHNPAGEAVFGEVACRPPGANMVDLMNYANDLDLFREWARVVVQGRFIRGPVERPWNAAIVFKRAIGRGRIRRIEGMDEVRRRFGPAIARDALLPVGAPRRDWKATFLSDGNVVVRHRDRDTTLEMARQIATHVRMYAE
jgi:hypothetical protein